MQLKSAITVETKTFNNHLGFERCLWQHQTRCFVVVPKRGVFGTSCCGASLHQSIRRKAAPRADATSKILIIPQCSRNARKQLNRNSARASHSIVATSGRQSVTSPNCWRLTVVNRTCKANQIDRLRITPTTAAVIALSAPFSRGWLEIQSM